MGTKAEPRYPDRAAMAKHLRWVAGTLLIIAAPAMIVGTRSSPLFLAAAAMIAAAVALLERRGRMAAEEIGQAFLTPLGMASLAFLAWALVSILWSSSPATTALSLLEALVPAASALIIAVGLSGQTRHFSSRTAALGLAFGLALACAVMLLDLATGMSLQRVLGSRAQAFVLNRAILTVLVVSTPVLWWLARDRLLPRSVYLAFGGLLAVSVISSHSGAAVVGSACALLIYGLARYAPRSAVGALLIGAFLSLAAAPVIGETLFRSISKAAHERMSRRELGGPRRDLALLRGGGARAPAPGLGFRGQSGDRRRSTGSADRPGHAGDARRRAPSQRRASDLGRARSGRSCVGVPGLRVFAQVHRPARCRRRRPAPGARRGSRHGGAGRPRRVARMVDRLLGIGRRLVPHRLGGRRRPQRARTSTQYVRSELARARPTRAKSGMRRLALWPEDACHCAIT